MKIKNIIKESWLIFKVNWWKIYIAIIIGILINFIGDFTNYEPAVEYVVSQEVAQKYDSGEIDRDQLALQSIFFDADRANEVLDQYFQTVDSDSENSLSVSLETMLDTYSEQTVSIPEKGSLLLSIVLLGVSILGGLLYGVYLTYVYLAMTRKEKAPLITGLKKLSFVSVLKYLLTLIFVGIISVLVGFAFFLSLLTLTLNVPYVWVITVALCAVLLFVFIRIVLYYYFAPLVSIDKNMWPLAAMRESKRLLKGNIASLFLLLLASLGVILLGALALLVGLLIAAPVTVLMLYVFYEHIQNTGTESGK